MASCILLAATAAQATLRIRGVGEDVKDVLVAFLTIDELPCDAPRWWVERRHRQAPDEIRRGMEVLGYYRAEVESSLEWGEECWLAVYVVEPGDPVRVQTFDVEVTGPLAEERPMRETLAGLDLGPEEPFSHRAYERVKAELMETAQALGYLDAEFTRRRVRVNPETNLAHIELTLDGGERYVIGRISVEQSVLEPELFHRYLRLEEGQPYAAELLARAYRNLIESEYFDRVLVSPDLDERAAGRVPIRVTASATTRRRVLVGAGYATDTGPRGRLDLRYRRINDDGHRAYFSSLVSAVRGELNAEYRIPYGDPTHQWLFLNGDVSYEETDTSESLERSLTLGRTQRRWRSWAETNYVELRRTDFEVGDQDGDSQLLLVGTSWARSTTIDTARPEKGYSLGVDVRGAAEALQSDTDLIQMIVRGRQIVHLGGRFRALARLQGGWTWMNEFDDLPPSVRFFAGGDNSVRGYGYEQLGPEEDGQVVGGRRLLVGSVELDARVRRNWSVALFADTGSAFDDRPNFSTGVGLGVRWYSPVGPLRIDLAHPLDDPDRNVRVHISLGPDL